MPARPHKKGTVLKSGASTKASIASRKTDEIVFAMVGPVGSGVTFTADLLCSLLENDFGYQGQKIKVSDLINKSASKVGLAAVTDDDEKRTSRLQDIGNALRKRFGSRYLADSCVREINVRRGNPNTQPQPRRFYTVIDSVKNPEEVLALREVYEEALWVIGVFAPETLRRKRLKQKGSDAYVAEILSRDEAEGVLHGQNVRATMELADFFVRNDGDNEVKPRVALTRFLEILFGIGLHTPSGDEIAMHGAASAASGSACLSRQVGAVIMSKGGEIIGRGMNDVPKFGGGLYGTDDREHDHRCFKWKNKECHNDRCKKELLNRMEVNLAESKVLKRGSGSAARESVQRAGVRDLIEFSRSVHAEMEAIISVARASKPGLVGSTLFSTTFPCHSCARHIVASGIERVVYIEPYPKSQALELHDDSVSVDEGDQGKKVVFLQYEGVAPANFLRLFKQRGERKQDGRFTERGRVSASPVSKAPLDGFITREQLVVVHLQDSEREVGPSVGGSDA